MHPEKIIRLGKQLKTENHFFLRFRKCVLLALPRSWKTAKWLIKITVPVSFVVFLLDFTGILSFISAFTSPVFLYLGLSGEAALVFITSIFTNIYSVIAIISMLGLPVREGIILATMCLISHGFIIESAVLRKTGSNLWRMLSLRLIMSFVAALLLNLILPQFEGNVKGGIGQESLEFFPRIYRLVVADGQDDNQNLSVDHFIDDHAKSFRGIWDHAFNNRIIESADEGFWSFTGCFFGLACGQCCWTGLWFCGIDRAGWRRSGYPKAG